MKNWPAEQDCPCGTGLKFNLCCQPLIEHLASALSAESLMRARFTAYALRVPEFLRDTAIQPERLRYVEDDNNDSFFWEKLIINSTRLEDCKSAATVDFSAHFKENGNIGIHSELSRFKRINGEWRYEIALRIGPAPYRREEKKIGRNSPCLCGSGKKYKVCCGN